MTALSPELEACFKPSGGGWLFAPGLFGISALLGCRFARRYRVNDAQKAAIGALMGACRHARARERWLVIGPAVLMSLLAALARSQPGGIALIPVPLLLLAATTIAIGLIRLVGLTWRFRTELGRVLADAPATDARLTTRELLRHRATTLSTPRIILMLAGTTISAAWFAAHIVGARDIQVANLVAAVVLGALAIRAGALLIAKRAQRTA